MPDETDIQDVGAEGDPSDDGTDEIQPEPVDPQPEPVIVGHGVVQDNVSEPGSQVTRTPDGEEIGRVDPGDDVVESVVEPAYEADEDGDPPDTQ